jgi:Uma2 family endonuclease
VTALVLNLNPFIATNEEFWELCRANPEIRFERLATGEVVAMPPAGSETGGRNAGITGQLWFWSQQSHLRQVFDSSAGFTLPNGAIRSPDAAWITRQRREAVPPALRHRFAPIAPDFVVELRSPSDELETVQAKLREYILNGVRLGWLIDPESRRVEINQPDEGVKILENPATVSGDPVLPGFVLDLNQVFAP